MKQTNGSIVAWHQDFGTYHRVDGVPEPRGIMIAVFVDDVARRPTPPSWPCPGRTVRGWCRRRTVDPTVARPRGPSPGTATTSPTRRWPDLVDRYGLEAITARAGSLLLMDMTVVHGSSVNITPLRRLVLYINVCPVDNRGETYERPEYYAARDFSPIQADRSRRLPAARFAGV